MAESMQQVALRATGTGGPERIREHVDGGALRLGAVALRERPVIDVGERVVPRLLRHASKLPPDVLLGPLCEGVRVVALTSASAGCWNV